MELSGAAHWERAISLWSWDGSSDDYLHVFAVQRAEVAGALYVRALRLAAERGVRVTDALTSPDDSFLERVVAAPACWTLLRTATSENIEQVVSVLADCHAFEERIRRTEALSPLSLADACAASTSKLRWSLLGDVVEIDGALRRLQVSRSGYLIDSVSPNARGPLREISGDHVGPTPESSALTMERFEGAFSVLARIGPPLPGFVRTICRTIVVRTDPNRSEFRAASTPLCNGRPVFHNPHQRGVTNAILADALVHESVHGMIDVLEICAPVLQAPGARTQRVVASPWTGRRLDVDTFLQACCVWYALASLWCRAIHSAKQELDEDMRDVEWLAQRAVRGFTGSMVEQALQGFGNALTSCGRHVILQVCENARRLAV